MQESDLPAKNDDVVCLTHRSARFAGKPRSNGDLISNVGAVLARDGG